MSHDHAYSEWLVPWDYDDGLDGEHAGPRLCGWPGCDEEGPYRAPKSPTRLRDFRWFCLEHVRVYNRAWDYFEGLGEQEIEEIRRRDTVWHRPSWPLGTRNGNGAEAENFHIPEDFDGFGQRAPARSGRDDALAQLGLDRSATHAEIKAQYKVLVKKHHPDANGGSKASEEQFKRINQAYTYLLNCGST